MPVAANYLLAIRNLSASLPLPLRPRPPASLSVLTYFHDPLSRKMLLYEDVVSGDEMFSDAFPLYVLLFSSSEPLTNLLQQIDRRHCLRN